MLGIIIGLIILIALTFKGWSILWVAPVAAIIVALVSGADMVSDSSKSI